MILVECKECTIICPHINTYLQPIHLAIILTALIHMSPILKVMTAFRPVRNENESAFPNLTNLKASLAPILQI